MESIIFQKKYKDCYLSIKYIYFVSFPFRKHSVFFFPLNLFRVGLLAATGSISKIESQPFIVSNGSNELIPNDAVSSSFEYKIEILKQNPRTLKREVEERDDAESYAIQRPAEEENHSSEPPWKERSNSEREAEREAFQVHQGHGFRSCMFHSLSPL